MNPPKRARWYFLHCWRVHFASWKCLHKHIKYKSLMVDVNYSWPDTPHHHDPGHSDQHGNSNHTRQYLRVATLINLANLPTPVNLAISAKPPGHSGPSVHHGNLGQPRQLLFVFALESLEPVRPGLKAKGSFKNSIQYNLANLATPNLSCLFWLVSILIACLIALEQPPWLTLTPCWTYT